MRKAIGLLAAFLLLLVSGWLGFRLAGGGASLEEKGAAGISIHPEGAVEAEAMADVRQASEAFREALQESMGEAPEISVSLFVAADAKDYERVLAREFHLPEAEAKTIAEISGGWSGGRNHITAIHAAAGVMGTSADRVGTTAHELFHQVQYELSRGHDTDARALFWLEEGSADYVGALVAERLGKRTLAKWQRDTLAELRMAPETIAPRELMHCDMERRKQIMGKKYHAYQMSDRMVCYLLEQQEAGTGLRKLAQYFRALGENVSGEEAFRQAFGLTVDEFLQGFGAWHAQQINQPACLAIAAGASVPAGLAGQLEAELPKMQQLFAQLWGRELKGEYEILLAADEAELAQDLQRACSLPEKRAQELADKSLWVENGSTVAIQAGQLADRRQAAFSGAVMLTRLLTEQVAGSSRDELEWLGRGTAYLVGIRHLAGEGGLAPYRRTWEAHLKGKRLPELQAIMATQDYLRAAADYGDERITELSELAVLTLVERHGWASLRDWMAATRASGSARQAFRQVYGMSAEDFSRQFSLFFL